MVKYEGKSRKSDSNLPYSKLHFTERPENKYIFFAIVKESFSLQTYVGLNLSKLSTSKDGIIGLLMIPKNLRKSIMCEVLATYL